MLCCSKSAREDAISQVKLKQLSKTQYELSKVEGFDLKSELEKMDEKMLLFNSFVAALHSIVASLPRSPLGKNVSCRDWVKKTCTSLKMCWSTSSRFGQIQADLAKLKAGWF